ncbi:MAG TPA: bifunctional diaminohydroxyphosphoribosylaminopyrimidine deaminase/5-amino-6-(5-phosphoribosylamino)uracil reductase RibD [Bacteroidales bacterium]|nr:bifunctional diaminohydroxyphosphoribosylaminopyrimidine deaminase/5-amino-6-(5-phosphoribosylamino)uracil reductase RibD [Bacteroidales bacterium]
MSYPATYMRRCLELASKGLGRVAPNPLVGCVVVHNDRVIGEGYHFRYGGSHAEVIAVEAVHDKSLLREATLYVNLEPCSHHGKTPPCADLIIALGIPHVVIGTEDPYPVVAGKGIQRLKDAGVQVECGLLAAECHWLNRRFFSFHRLGRPYVVLKWAVTDDGFMAPAERGPGRREQGWISGNTTRVITHRWRSEEDAVMVGSRTLQFDDPELNVRHYAGRNPVRVLLDMRLEAGKAMKAMQSDARVIVINGVREGTEGHLEYRRIAGGSTMVNEVLHLLHSLEIQSLIVEGGAQILSQFIAQGLWDEARVIRGNKHFGQGLPAPVLGQASVTSLHAGDDTIDTYYNMSGPFFPKKPKS